MADIGTKTEIVLRFTLFNGETKKLEIRDTDDLGSIENAKGCLWRSGVAMQGGCHPPSPENVDQTYRLFGVKKSHLYTFMGMMLKQETLLVRDARVLGITWDEKKKRKNG